MATNILKLQPSRIVYSSENVEFYPSFIQTNGIINTTENIGIEGFEKFICVSSDRNTIPHIDKFNTLRDTYGQLPPGIYDDGNIILRGNTADYTIKKYDDDLTSLKQYFLENQTRDEIQYLIWDSGENSPDRFTPFIPGLLYSNLNGAILGYIHSYVADENNSVTIELPYSETDYTNYGVAGDTGGMSVNRQGNILTLTWSSMFEPRNMILYYSGAYSASASFYVYPNTAETVDTTYTVKNVNEFGDYLVAAGKCHSSVKYIIEILAEFNPEPINTSTDPVDDPNYVYFPKTYPSLILYSPSESVPNITPSIYKVPVALVTNGDYKVMMKDVTGVAINKILTGAL